jgi:hypothetical protein
MELTLANSTLKDDVYSWEVPLSNYKIQTITVVSSTYSFQAIYNDKVTQCMQYLESRRSESTCPVVFSGNFSVSFFDFIPRVIIKDIQDIHIELVSV